MRILHVQKAKGIGGSERHLAILLPALAAAGHDVRAAILVADGGEQFVQLLNDKGISAVSVPAGPDFNPVAVAAVRREIRRFRPDVVHTHLVHADLHGQLAAKLARTPGVSSFHGTRSFESDVIARLERRAQRWARATVAISSHVARYLVERRIVGVDDVTVVYYGIDASAWVCSESDQAEARSRLGYSRDDVVVGIASRLIAGKGHAELFAALAVARRDVPTLRLVVAGTGPLEAELRSRAAEVGVADQVQFLGFVDDVRGVLAGCDLVALPTLPSLGEGFGLVSLEAMATGRAVVATAIASVPEIVHDGVTGVLVPPDDEHALAAALVRLARDPVERHRLGAAGRERAESEFTVDAMVAGTIGVYERACE